MPLSDIALRRAIAHYKVARILSEQASEEEELLVNAGFHLQQTIEFAIKSLLRMNAIDYCNAQGINQLTYIANEHNIDLKLNKYIEGHVEMFSRWESKARYVLGYSIEAKKLDRALKEVDEYLAAVAEAERAQQ